MHDILLLLGSRRSCQAHATNALLSEACRCIGWCTANDTLKTAGVICVCIR